MKWILLIIVFLIHEPQFAKPRKFTAISYSFSSTNKIGKWKECEVPIVWEVDSGLVKIFSEANQRILYLNMAYFDYDSVKISVANSIDENNLKMLFRFIEFKESGKFIEISYSNIQYVYEVKEE